MQPSSWGSDSDDDILTDGEDVDEDLQQLLAVRSPRRRRPPSLTTALGAAVLLVLGFAAGVATQQTRSEAGAERSATPTAPPQAADGAVIGAVRARDGETLFVATAGGDVIEVIATDATIVDPFSRGAVQDINPGSQVTVAGVLQADGTVVATTVTEGAPQGP